MTTQPIQPRGANADASRIPAWIYTSPEIYARELDRFFYGAHWSYVGLEAEIPNKGDFKQTFIGERSVLLARGRKDEIFCVENRCAHRGVRFCRENFGNATRWNCPYHRWTYQLDGRLMGVPLSGGVEGKGGMPEDFKTKDHGLRTARVARHNGLVFATLSDQAEPFEAYIGEKVMRYVDRVFDGRKLTVLGYSRQRIPGNWKLMQENIKDPYHPGLLHSWFVTFGLWRADQTSRMIMDERGRHACMISSRNAGGAAAGITEVASFQPDMTLADDRILDIVPEAWWNGPSVVMTTLFPSVILQQQVNSLSTRQIVPRGAGVFDFVWTHFGYEDDDEAMTRRRLRQANLFGPAGYVSADDGEVIEFAQQGLEQDAGFSTVNALGGHGIGDTDHMITETLIRGMYAYWRSVMEA